MSFNKFEKKHKNKVSNGDRKEQQIMSEVNGVMEAMHAAGVVRRRPGGISDALGYGYIDGSTSATSDGWMDTTTGSIHSPDLALDT